MPSTRSSTRGETNSSPVSVKSAAGSKRKADASSPSSKDVKRGRQVKTQKTIEETIDPNDEAEKPAANDKPIESNGSTNGHAQKHEENGHADALENGDAMKQDNTSQPEAQEKQADQDVEMKDSSENNPNAFDQVKAQENEPGKTTKEPETSDNATEPSKSNGTHDASESKQSQEQDAPQSATGNAIETDSKRKEAMPSNILEKGIVYFFTRGRVGTDDPNSVQDLARSYFVLRPLPQGAKLTEGSIQDGNTNRLFALPKKVWPKSGRDRFMAFVEKAKTSMSNLKEEFFQGSEYSTKTTGTRHTPPVTPVGEGVYAITTTGGGQGTTHLAYMLTIPSTISEVQKDLGLSEKGSFVLSLKNPEASGPANAALPEKPDWPKEYIEEFSGRSWMPVHPKHLDYANAQVLMIGEDFDSSNNLEPKPEDEKDESKETPQEELQKLEEEDEHRVEALKGDDSIFVDLGLSSRDYPKVMTTW